MVEIRITGENLDELLAKVFGLRAKQASGADIAKDADLEVYEVNEISVEEPETQEAPAEPVKVEEPKRESKPEVKIEDVRAAGKAYMAKHGRDAFMTVLEEFGVKRATDCPADKLGDLLAKLEG